MVVITIVRNVCALSCAGLTQVVVYRTSIIVTAKITKIQIANQPISYVEDVP